MDLQTIKKNVDSGMIRTTAEFQRDMMLMFINAMMYNNVEHDVHKMAVEMYSDVMTHIEVSIWTTRAILHIQESPQDTPWPQFIKYPKFVIFINRTIGDH